jgi:hypothetical protein
MTKRNPLICGVLLAALGIGLGCASEWEKYRNEPPSPVESHWGESYHQVKTEQVANPCTDQDSTPPEGMTAAEADTVVDYHADRRTPEYQNSPRGSIVSEIEE